MRARGQKRFRTILFLGVGVGMSALVLGAYAGGLVRSFEFQTVDERFSLRGSCPSRCRTCGSTRPADQILQDR